MNTNKAFKSDSQRMAVSLRSSIAKRRSHLNAALVANEKNAAKTKYLGLRSCVFGSVFVFQFLVIWVCENRSQVSFVVGFSVLETDSLAESQLCDVVIFK
ncbi:hypothetical protein [Vibrio diabolicus]|uniref:hypothetical protein n=1 Tax=Vibrio diabolicus TaxID=50719 RepID=UPI002940C49E|nr:hypothetical protein [Vibrio diabolicus]MDV5062282.1 hypothetical protein [Vibrio diabolicus]